jgi:hypothetical protein
MPQVNESVLKKVIEWCEHHKNDPPAPSDDDSDSRKKTTDIEEWDQKFMQVDQEMLFEIILVSFLITLDFLIQSPKSFPFLVFIANSTEGTHHFPSNLPPSFPILPRRSRHPRIHLSSY